MPVPFDTWTGATVAVSASTTGKTYYVDTKSGSDSNAGTSLSAPLKTISSAVSKVTAGDTILVKAGLYREIVNLGTSGSAGKPITLGSYGDGEVIVDGSPAVTGWTNYSGTVWKATVSGGSSIDTVVVNNVPLVKYKTTKAIPASGSGQWYFDGSSTLYADMGSVNPTSSSADVFVVRYNHGSSTIFLGYNSYWNIIGLTIRGSGWSGIWSYPDTKGGQYVTVAYCDIKFNDGNGLNFGGGSNNSALYNHVYHNVLNNWPFGANGYGVAGGGWPGGLGFSTEANPVARGNIISMNGGEGLISYGNGKPNGIQSGNTLFEQNVSYDNWSMNSYVDNQPNHTIRNNLFYRHQPNKAWMWDQSDVYTMEKFRVCLALADEYASGSPAGTSAMANAKVYNNLFVGCRYGINDYAESVSGHGMKNDLIMNNTIIMDNWSYSQENIAGIMLGGSSADTNSVIANNIIYRPSACSTDCSLVSVQSGSKLSGVSLNNNVYYAAGAASTATSLFATNSATSPNNMGFANWVSSQGQDSNSVYADPQFVDVTGLTTSTSAPDYTKAAVGSGSPARGLASPNGTFNIDFAGVSRGASWTTGALQ